MRFEYCPTITINCELEVEDVGNCAIEAFDSDGATYYCIIHTTLGVTRMFEYGPIVPDINELPKSVKCNIIRIQYDLKKIATFIDKFLNRPKIEIKTAKIIKQSEALCCCRDLVNYMSKIIDDSGCSY